MYVGMHGSCVRSKRWVHSLQQPCYLIVIYLARTHRPMYIDLHSQRNGRTDRASLHASCLQIIFIIRLILKVKVQCSMFKVKVPTCLLWAYCNVQTSKFTVKLQCSNFKEQTHVGRFSEHIRTRHQLQRSVGTKERRRQSEDQSQEKEVCYGRTWLRKCPSKGQIP